MEWAFVVFILVLAQYWPITLAVVIAAIYFGVKWYRQRRADKRAAEQHAQ